MPILNYTTQINANKTVGEIQQILAKGKAKQISVDYNDIGEPSALQFMIVYLENPIYFRLPCNVDGVLKALQRARVPGRLRTEAQARRVAWRIIKDWIERSWRLLKHSKPKWSKYFCRMRLIRRGKPFFSNLRQVSRNY